MTWEEHIFDQGTGMLIHICTKMYIQIFNWLCIHHTVKGEHMLGMW